MPPVAYQDRDSGIAFTRERGNSQAREKKARVPHPPIIPMEGSVGASLCWTDSPFLPPSPSTLSFYQEAVRGALPVTPDYLYLGASCLWKLSGNASCPKPENWGLWDNTASWALVLRIVICSSEAAYKLHPCTCLHALRILIEMHWICRTFEENYILQYQVLSTLWYIPSLDLL